MHLRAQIERLLTRFIANEIPVTDLRDWFAVYAQAIAQDGDSEARLIADTIELLVSEYDYGHRTEEEIRREAVALLGAIDTHNPPSIGILSSR
ncbi:MAG: hypothetical protein HW416_1912 [Chloroflexi bacterium]|nr:hypothetical protein [Chloroflexota bacterium]